MQPTTTGMFLCSVFLLATPALAQKPQPGRSSKPASEGGKDGKASNKEAARQPAPPAPKDDAVTAKDPAIVAIDRFRKAQVSQKRADWKSTMPAPPLQRFSPQHDYFWHVVTDQGKLVLRLLPEAAPMHVTSLIYLARCGFYDDLQFPRIIKGFMAQGGSPFNNTTGNAGYNLDGEFLTGQKHDRPGMLSAANSGQPMTDGSQFFLTFVPTPHLDGKHSVYGITVEGLEVLQAIEACGAEKDGVAPNPPVTILRSWIRVAEKPPEPAGEENPPPERPAGG